MTVRNSNDNGTCRGGNGGNGDGSCRGGNGDGDGGRVHTLMPYITVVAHSTLAVSFSMVVRACACTKFTSPPMH